MYVCEDGERGRATSEKNKQQQIKRSFLFLLAFLAFKFFFGKILERINRAFQCRGIRSIPVQTTRSTDRHRRHIVKDMVDCFSARDSRVSDIFFLCQTKTFCRIVNSKWTIVAVVIAIVSIARVKEKPQVIKFMKHIAQEAKRIVVINIRRFFCCCCHSISPLSPYQFEFSRSHAERSTGVQVTTLTKMLTPKFNSEYSFCSLSLSISHFACLSCSTFHSYIRALVRHLCNVSSRAFMATTPTTTTAAEAAAALEYNSANSISAHRFYPWLFHYVRFFLCQKPERERWSCVCVQLSVRSATARVSL